MIKFEKTIALEATGGEARVLVDCLYHMQRHIEKGERFGASMADANIIENMVVHLKKVLGQLEHD